MKITISLLITKRNNYGISLKSDLEGRREFILNGLSEARSSLAPVFPGPPDSPGQPVKPAAWW
ncbi:MAG: hypothetical protein JWL81_1298 [Verrucomicrobiales bacterium]|nr:hypothetical protein [Verrucomicrobiales bacterium]